MLEAVQNGKAEYPSLGGFRPLLCKILGTSEIGCGLLGVSVGLKPPTCRSHRDLDFSDPVNLACINFA